MAMRCFPWKPRRRQPFGDPALIMARKSHGSHGGAWKVAYADFVTAMMALFLVLWLASQDVKIKEAVQRSFTNPFSSLTKESVGIMPNKDAKARTQDKS